MSFLINRLIVIRVVAHGAGLAAGVSRLAGLSSVENEQVRRHGPAPLRDNPAKVLLYLVWVVRVGEAEPLTHPLHMGVHGEGLLFESVAEHYVGGLSSHPWKTHEVLDGVGDTAVEVLGYLLAAVLYAPGLVPVKVYGAYLLLELFEAGFRVVTGGFIFLEELLRNLVYELVRGLCGEYGGYEEFKGVGKFEGRACVREFLFQDIKDLARLFTLPAFSHKPGTP